MLVCDLLGGLGDVDLDLRLRRQAATAAQRSQHSRRDRDASRGHGERPCLPCVIRARNRTKDRSPPVSSGSFGLEPHFRHFGAGEFEARGAALHAGGVEAALLQDGATVALHQQDARAARAVTLVDDERRGNDALPVRQAGRSRAGDPSWPARDRPSMANRSSGATSGCASSCSKRSRVRASFGHGVSSR